MDALKHGTGASVPLESVLCTEELKRRPSRPPDYQVENQALLALAKDLTSSPGSVLQRLVDVALELCRGHSAGISLLEEDGPPGSLSPGGDHFRWHAVAGQWAPLVWNTTTPRDDGPCGTVLDRNVTLLFANAHRYYVQFAGVHPLLVEGLLVPFHVNSQAVGTVWVIAHDETRKFDGEDRRLLESLATFAATAYQIRLSNVALAKANHDLQTEIAERQRAEEALRQTDRRKSEFLAMLAHELRNPLAPMRNAVEILRRSGGDDQRVNPATEMMQRQLGQMVRLVDDLLDVSRISRGSIHLRREPVELASIVHQAVEAARPLCATLDHELTVTLPPQAIYLDADPSRLAQVVGNLLSNACKFTERGGHIRLSVEREGNEALVRVQDTGIGIAAEQLPRIFEMFTQVDTSLERSRDGLGVGLPLVKNVVDMHGGTVEARSRGLGQGSEFVVRLPILSAPPPPRPREPSGSKPVATVPRRILVVDDNRDAADSLAMLLKLTGHDVRIAGDGLEALEEAATFTPHVILLDIGLPRLNGYEAARRIRDQQRHEGLTLVALTGWGQEEDRRRSEEAGFDAHLIKPVDFAALTKLLAESVPTPPKH
jgi:signal transduction histidine kinase/ActR/RegA family two-component response regulator